MAVYGLPPDPTNEAVKIIRIDVSHAHRLIKKDIFGTSDPYVKITLYDGPISVDEALEANLSGNPSYLVDLKHTRTIKRDLNPKWRESFKFRVNVQSSILLFEVFDENRLTRDDFLGLVTFRCTTLSNESCSRLKDYQLMPRTSKSRVKGTISFSITVIERNRAATSSNTGSQLDFDQDSDWHWFEDGSRAPSPYVPDEGYADNFSQQSTYQNNEFNPQTPNESNRSTRARYQTLRRHISEDFSSSSLNDTQAVSSPPPVFENCIDDDNGPPLPEGWDMARSSTGRTYFIDHITRRTTWTDPRTENLSTSAANAEFASSLMATRPLPDGWEERQTAEGRYFYVDHHNRRTTWEHPLLQTSVAGPQLKFSLGYKRKYEHFKAKLKQPPPHPNRCELKVSREDLFESSFRAVMSISDCNILRARLWVEFEGEKGLDYGGVSREWFTELSRKMFNPSYGLFEYSAIDLYTLQINPNSSICNSDHIQFFRFIGRVCAMAVYHGKLIDAFFIRPFYKKMLNKDITLEDMQAVDEVYYNSLDYMKRANESELNEICYDFTMVVECLGTQKTVELVPNGANIPLTIENRDKYIQCVINYRFHDQIASQFDAFMSGFSDVIDPQLLICFDENELELLLGGLPEVNVNDWRENTEYKEGFYPEHPIIQWFWRIVMNYNNQQRCRLLQFVTGTSRLPMNGFSQLYGSNGLQKFTIQMDKDKRHLPRAHTCFNRLELPYYDSEKELLHKLNLVLELGVSGFDGVD